LEFPRQIVATPACAALLAALLVTFIPCALLGRAWDWIVVPLWQALERVYQWGEG
jgi:hypothetical protein